MTALPDPEAERAGRMGAVAFLRLRKADLAAAAEGRDPAQPSGGIVMFPGVRIVRDEPAPIVYEDPRWADLHRQT